MAAFLEASLEQERACLPLLQKRCPCPEELQTQVLAMPGHQGPSWVQFLLLLGEAAGLELTDILWIPWVSGGGWWSMCLQNGCLQSSHSQSRCPEPLQGREHKGDTSRDAADRAVPLQVLGDPSRNPAPGYPGMFRYKVTCSLCHQTGGVWLHCAHTGT